MASEYQRLVASKAAQCCHKCGGNTVCEKSVYTNYLVYRCVSCNAFGTRIHIKNATADEIKASRGTGGSGVKTEKDLSELAHFLCLGMSSRMEDAKHLKGQDLTDVWRTINTYQTQISILAWTLGKGKTLTMSCNDLLSIFL